MPWTALEVDSGCAHRAFPRLFSSAETAQLSRGLAKPQFSALQASSIYKLFLASGGWLGAHKTKLFAGSGSPLEAFENLASWKCIPRFHMWESLGWDISFSFNKRETLNEIQTFAVVDVSSRKLKSRAIKVTSCFTPLLMFMKKKCIKMLCM